MICETFHKAKIMGVNKLAAARVRVRYLLECVDVYLEDGSDLAMFWAEQDLREAFYLLENAGYTIEHKASDGFLKVTDAEIEQAKQYPIDRLVDFSKGRATAWCHDDRNPSLVHNRKENKVYCPVCHKQWNSVEVTMIRNNLKFYDAVRSLI